MKGKSSFSPPAVGGSSLLVIFGVLCLTVFALLSYSSAQAERRMADAAVQAVTDYYETDLRAEEIFARLRAGEQVPSVRVEDGLYEFELPMSERQILSVQLHREEDSWKILRWQTLTKETAADETLDVWKGTVESP